MPRIFMSYRRSDSIAESGRIHDHLEREFGGANVFKDVDDIQPGYDFREVLDEEVSKCDVLLAIIGPRWVSATDTAGNSRLQNPDDFVRIEIESGLKRGDDVLVIPVLINNASMPSPDLLPDSLKELTYRNAVIIRNDPDFNRDMRRLIDYIRRYTRQQRPSSVSRSVLIGGGIVGVALIAVLLGAIIFRPPSAPGDATATPTGIRETPTDTTEPGDKARAEALYNEAQEKAANASYSEAIDLYTEAIEVDPTYAPAYVGRALVSASGYGDYSSAITDLERAISHDPNYGEAYRYLGLYQYYENEYEMVEANLQRALELNPSDVDARLWLANYYSNDAEYESALEQYEALLSAPDRLDIDKHYDVWLGKGNIQSALGNDEEALVSFQNAININPERAEAYASIGNVHVYQGDYPAAIESLNTAIDKATDNPDLFHNRALAHYGLQHYTEAIADFNRVLQLNPNYLTAYVGRGRVHRALEDYDAAIADFNQAITRDDSYGEAYYFRGLSYYDSGNYELAIDDFSQAIDTDTFTAEAYGYRGLSHVHVDDTYTAQEDLEIALEYGVQDDLQYELLTELGWLKLNEGLDAEALQYFSQATTLRPDQAKAYKGQADVFINRGYNAESDSDAVSNWLSAVSSLTEAIEVAPDYPALYVERGTAYYQLGILTENDEHLQSAADDFEQAIALDESNIVAHIQLAELALLLDRYSDEDAVNFAETAYELNESDPSVLWTLGYVHESLGNVDEARLFYQQAVENSDDESEREYYQSELDRLANEDDD